MTDAWRAVFQHSSTPILQHSVSCFYSSDSTILMWQLRLRIGPAEPRAFGVNRLRIEAFWATASLMMSSSALAMADLRVLATRRAPLRGTTLRTAAARWAGIP